MSSQILVQVLTRGFGFSTPTFVVFIPICMNWLWMDRIMIFWFVLSLKSLIAAISQSSVPLALVEPNRGCGILLLVPRVWLCMLGMDSAPTGRTSYSVLAMNPVCFAFAVGSTISMFIPFTVTHVMTVHFMTLSMTLLLGYSQLMIKQSCLCW